MFVRASLVLVFCADLVQFSFAAGAFALEGTRHTVKVFYINLQKADVRRKHMEEQLAQYWVNAERYDAVDHTRVDAGEFDEEYILRQGLSDRLRLDTIDDRILGRHVRNATVACFLSHTTLLQRLQDRGELGPDDLAVILEDDVSVPVDWVSRLKAVLKVAPVDWSLLKVSGWGSARDEDRLTSGSWLWSQVATPVMSFLGLPVAELSIYKTNPPFFVPVLTSSLRRFYYAGSSGYVVRGSALPVVLAHLKSQPISDFDEMLLSEGEYNAYEFYPYVFDLSGDHGVQSMHINKDENLGQSPAQVQKMRGVAKAKQEVLAAN